MKVLYKNEEDALSVMEVHKAEYDPEEQVLSLCGPEEDFGIHVKKERAEEIVRELYTKDMADVTSYPYLDIDVFDDDDDDFEDEEDLEDYVDNLLDSMDNQGFRGVHRIPFPKK